MRFQQLLLTAASFGIINSATGNPVPAEGTTVPDGGYAISTFDNGTALYTPLDGSSAPIVVKLSARGHDLSARGAGLAKRRTDCWGYQLDAAGIDASANDLRSWAGSGSTLTSGEKPNAFGYLYKNVGVYYCINARYKWGNLNVNDINYALAQMDSKCRRYEASWFGWDGSVEIVGKARVTDRICQG